MQYYQAVMKVIQDESNQEAIRLYFNPKTKAYGQIQKVCKVFNISPREAVELAVSALCEAIEENEKCQKTLPNC